MEEKRRGGVKEDVNFPVGWFDSKNSLRQQADSSTVHTIINPPEYKLKDYI